MLFGDVANHGDVSAEGIEPVGEVFVAAVDRIDITERRDARSSEHAEHNNDMDVEKMFVSSCSVDQGPTLKRIHPRSRGQAFKILKRSSHVTVAVSEK